MLAITFVCVLLMTFSVLMVGTRGNADPKALKLRLASIRDSAQSSRTGEPLLDLTEGEQLGFQVRLSNYVARYKFGKTLAALIGHAGSDRTVGGVLLTMAASAFVAGLLVFIFVPLLPVRCAAPLAGALLPLAMLRFKRTKRLKKFNDAMPDAIDLMARSLRAGHSIGAAIEMVGEQSPEPLGTEFLRVFQQQRFGLRFRDALLEMSDRVPSPDLHFLVTAILVQRETGGDLTDILDRTTYVIRERVRIQGEVRVYTAQGRLTGWILSLLPIILLLLVNILSPGYSSLLFHDPTGKKLLYAAAGLIVVGSFLISRIVDIRV